MKIIYLCSSLERTGPTNQLFNIVSNLDTSTFSSLVITLSTESDKSFLSKFVEKGISVKSLELSHRASMKELRLALMPFLDEFSPDVIHSQGIRSDKLISTLNYPIKKIATLRNIPYKDYPMAYGWLLGRIMSYVHLKALSKLDQAVTVSYGVQEELIGKLTKNLKVVQNGADHHFFTPVISEFTSLESLKNKLGISNENKVLVYTGILEARKKLDLLYDLIDTSNNIKLLVVGDGELKESLEIHDAVKNQKVIMLGSVDDVRPFLAISDAFISLSSAEGLPNSMIEAMMMGLPVIASDIAPHAELIIDKNVPIMLFSMDKPNLVASFLTENLAGWLDRSQSFDLRKYTIKNFSAQSMSNQYQELYRELLNNE
ncbi:glycosyltransferase family 4 protein [Colwellia hornerae]|uniref:Glycosyltransferase family 4 protein n=1 Tax=Colwellia hornerae TaxID=89402 RepID=A0A5C6QK75_9GAMM|nr:glycosyltransferase family 4 protein [Colwellia hornerae]TWX54028.1 glycosyltransferase family 4 protein [Colwellia hornerae]TWX60803.1 glycosyltransferase family 4 protein [Colwellia hornerae]TWX69133.1 glycosyltransferase family 4 protein [Colwellia hornerae]